MCAREDDSAPKGSARQTVLGPSGSEEVVAPGRTKHRLCYVLGLESSWDPDQSLPFSLPQFPPPLTWRFGAGLVLSLMVALCHICLLSTWNVAAVTEFFI